MSSGQSPRQAPSGGGGKEGDDNSDNKSSSSNANDHGGYRKGQVYSRPASNYYTTPQQPAAQQSTTRQPPRQVTPQTNAQTQAWAAQQQQGGLPYMNMMYYNYTNQTNAGQYYQGYYPYTAQPVVYSSAPAYYFSPPPQQVMYPSVPVAYTTTMPTMPPAQQQPQQQPPPQQQQRSLATPSQATVAVSQTGAQNTDQPRTESGTAPVIAVPGPPTVPTPTATTATPPAVVPDAKSQKKKISIKNADGSEVDLGQLAAKKAPSIKTEVNPTPPEPAVPIPSMPVSLPPKSEVAAPEPVKPVVADLSAVSVTPIASKKSEEEEKSSAVTPEQSTARRLKPQANLATPASKVIKKYTRQDILALKPASIPELDLQFDIVTTKLESPMQKNASTEKTGNAADWKGAKGGRNDKEWKHEAVPTTPKKKAAPAAPKKEITDPMQLLEHNVVYVLNQITPDSFEPLSKQLLALELKNSAMVQRVVELIFDKAVKDHNFSGMYALLCHFLKEESIKTWVFHMVVKNVEENNYFWIRDFEFPAAAAGPFFSKKDVLDTEDFGPLKPFTSSTNEEVEYFLLKQKLLIKLMTTTSASGKQYYVSYVSFDEVPTDQRAVDLFENEQDAGKSGQGATSFRANLAKICEIEFTRSVTDENLFKNVDQELHDLINSRSTMSETDYLTREGEITERRFQLKSRMIGCILFIGELYKQKILNTETMHDCIITLLGKPGEWKASYDPQDLELLCKLLTTLGSYLESKSKSMSKKKPQLESNFELFFDRMTQLTKDKMIDSRIRFQIDDVITMRKNGWKLRREKEGPLKLSEIHQRVQEEEQKTANIARQNSLDAQRSTTVKGGDARATTSRSVGRVEQREKLDRNEKEKDSSKAKRESKAKSTAPPPSDAFDPKSLTFKNDAILRKVKTVVDEFLSGEEGEIKALLKEGGPELNGYLLHLVLSKVLDMKEGNDKMKLLSIFDDEDTLKSLGKYQGAIVEAALEQYDNLKGLVDAVVDWKDAPEKLGSCVRILITKNLITYPKVESLVEVFKNEEKSAGYNSPEDIDSAFSRFAAASKP